MTEKMIRELDTNQIVVNVQNQPNIGLKFGQIFCLQIARNINRKSTNFISF